ncbi:hypothetical protein BRADI_4g11608v3 [Brachypodium distachyon]|uniref:Uncharacterized protein n=1 Tax=Brachypodium distachyon TaxID=15368 RepID=A0A2K2CM72_BRADI|nr:hypothetical protein BRADI_4g11608v3 [Brachypodium distachyon]
MPGLPLPSDDATKNGGGSRSADETCEKDTRVGLLPNEELSLQEYCKPVMLYEIFQARAIEKPPWLQRCLRYRIDAKRKTRSWITVSISRNRNDVLPTQGIFPLHILYATPASNVSHEGHSPVYQFSRACPLTSFIESGDSGQAKATFCIPGLESLADSKDNIILISYGQRGQNLCEKYPETPVQYSSSEKLGGKCSWGTIPIDLLVSTLENSIPFSLGHTVELTKEIRMSPGFVEQTFLEKNNCLTFCYRKTDATGSYGLHASIYAQEAGARGLSPYSSYSDDDVPLFSSPRVIRIRTGNVSFIYKCKDKKFIDADFSCSICLVRCGSFKGLECHLTSSHDLLFRFEFSASKDCQAVNVSLKTVALGPELLPAGMDPRERMFFYRRFKRCRRLEATTEKIKLVDPNIMEPGSPRNMGHIHAHITESGSPEKAQKESDVDHVPKENDLPSSRYEDHAVNAHREESLGQPQTILASGACTQRGPADAQALPASPAERAIEEKMTTCFPNTIRTKRTGISVAQPSIDPSPALHGRNHLPPSVLKFGKTRKLPVDQDDHHRNRLLLQKREFFHSQKAQRMELEEVLGDHDSEKEIDYDIADLEDRRLLDDFSDVRKDEKRIMHMWNSFVRRQRVVADRHVPWACEAFSRHHAQELVDDPDLRWCWRLLMIELWKHGLLNGRTMDSCNVFLDNFKKESTDPKEP